MKVHEIEGLCYLQEVRLPVILSVDAKDSTNRFRRAANAAKLVLHSFRLIISSDFIDWITVNCAHIRIGRHPWFVKLSCHSANS